MRLQLTVRQTEPMPGARDEVRRFDRLPVVIGRANACDLVLVDESRFISSNHAVISLVDGAPCLRDTSANGVFVNGDPRPLGRGNEVPLHDRDVIAVGDYALTVAFDDATRDGVGVAAPSADGHAFEDDPFAALIDDAHDLPAPDGVSAGARPGGVPPPAEDPFDPFRGGEPGWSEPGNESPSVDEDWDDWPSGGDAEPRETARAAGRVDGRAASGASSPGRPPAPPRSTASGNGWPSREPPPARAEGAGPGPGGVPAHGSPPRDALVDALLLQCIDGLMALLRSRSELKQAMRTDVTSLAGVGNNPLKFSRDGREALERLLRSGGDDAYLDPHGAVGEAIDDLSLHQVAMLEGMKGAVGALLERFDPERLAESLTADHPIASSIPLTRDAKLWERFRERYHDIEETARGDFSALFGREFTKAYEARVRELGREPDLW